jgi:hypothetical protein
MSISPIVDANYRLLPADLEGKPRQVVISNVTYQGIEEMSPVLHFVGQTKRLVLSAEQANRVIEIAGTPLFPQWIGTSLVLLPSTSKGESRILIEAPDKKPRASVMPHYVSEEQRGWYFAFVVVGFLLSLSMIYVAFNFAPLLAAFQELRDNWLLR